MPYGESFTKEWFSSEISKHHYEKAKMKTYKNLYKNLLSKDYIKQVMLENLGSKKYADKVKANIDSYVDYIYQSLVNKNYALKPTKTIVIHDRKKDRNITLSPYFPNKIYDYLITSQLKPIIKNSLFYWCIGNVKGKGKDMGVKYVFKMFKKNKYAVQLDIRKFYDNINKFKLYEFICKKVKDRDFTSLYKKVIGINGKGISLGLNSSQWLANFYLQEFDYFVKQKLKVKSYCRYVDNIVIESNNKMRIQYFIREIILYLKKLGLEIKPNWYISDKQIKFLGYKITKTKIELDKSLFHRLCRLWNRMKKNKSKRRARTIVSLWGWFTQTTHYNFYYSTHLKPTMSLRNIIEISKIKVI